MALTDALRAHREVCDALYDLALEENRWLKEQQRAPQEPLLLRKRDLLERLDRSLAQLRSDQAGTEERDPERRAVVEKAREKILQILHLDRENEQLLLRYSLGPKLRPAAPAVPSAANLRNVYQKHLAQGGQQ